MEENLRKLSHLVIQDNPRTIEFCIFVNETIAIHLNGSCDKNVCKVYPGQLAKSIGVEGNDKRRVLLYSDDNEKWYDVIWKCNLIDLRLISPLIWKLLCPITNFQERIKIANNENLCKEIENIKKGSKVLYNQSGSEQNLMEVKSIGSVLNRGFGYYFGLDFSVRKYYPMFVDTDNNNKMIDDIACDISNCAVKNKSEEQQNYKKKLDKNLTYFDPLDSDYEMDEIQPTNIQQYTNPGESQIGSQVKVLMNNDTHCGVIRWIGYPEGSNKLTATIEFDYKYPSATNGNYQNLKYIRCNPVNAYVTDLNRYQQYVTASSSCYSNSKKKDFKPTQNSVANEIVPPIKVKDNTKNIFRKYRGIQGHHNSCYLDATLFSMFAFTSVFDFLLWRSPNEEDCLEYMEVQKVLREEIVNPLRKKLCVTAPHVMKLRTLLEKSSSISGLTSEEKDPEEFLTSLLAHTLKAKPFLKFSSGQDAYLYQLFVEKDDKLVFPSVQHLLEQSFKMSKIRLKEVPSCFIIQMPRFGKSYKMYSKIQPTLLLDVTDIIEDPPKKCNVCDKLASYECTDCPQNIVIFNGFENAGYCNSCLKRVHSHVNRKDHKPNKLVLPMEYEEIKKTIPVHRSYLELRAVVCIETSHYVSFVKCGPGSDAPWCFFDSMADRKGEQNGYNIPEIVQCSEFSYWFSNERASKIASLTDDRLLPKYTKRLLCDAYMCVYQSQNKL
ncbi:PREDICTED: ubiquitin carboxyl-terminal hydrolase CYLD [Ceratosolen solmsi marchali]|uniref:Ubiquitin carboxyl-terminal hydrolase CYLD n=1 Tax=Ceratosolen solmsi marchali TaxID=326594 RepID=A0AAJ7DWT1_9HYME|nr:PREDICTED: ubiquitin carboxyl-terminal hydrolase CYLD [Ceratosolen solmsi marchali]